jgi:hypothetical protein
MDLSHPTRRESCCTRSLRRPAHEQRVAVFSRSPVSVQARKRHKGHGAARAMRKLPRRTRLRWGALHVEYRECLGLSEAAEA